MKKIIRIILLSFCMLFLTGCGKFISEEKEYLITKLSEKKENFIEHFIERKVWTDEEIYEKAVTKPIRSYNLSNVSNNNFSLGVSKDNKLFFVYIKGVEGYKLQSINSNKVEIIESDEIEPCIKGYFNSDETIYRNSFEIKEYNRIDKAHWSLFLNYRIYVPSNYSLVTIDDNSFDLNNFIGSLEG